MPFGLLILAACFLGAPVFIGMGRSPSCFFVKDGLPPAAVSVEIYRLISSPTLPAIPLLVACGYVVAESGAPSRLLRFFRALLGWMPGGLAIITIMVGAIFTTFTGGSGLTIIALGGLMYPMLREDGYPERFSLGLVTATGSLGLLFPPSLPVILYSVVAGARDHNVPEDLYLAGLLPGPAHAGARRGVRVVRRNQARPSAHAFLHPELAVAFWAAKWELALAGHRDRPLRLRPHLHRRDRGRGRSRTRCSWKRSSLATCPPRPRCPGPRRSRPSLTGAVLILMSAAMGITSYIVDAQIPDALVSWVKTHISPRWCSCSP